MFRPANMIVNVKRLDMFNPTMQALRKRGKLGYDYEWTKRCLGGARWQNNQSVDCDYATEEDDGQSNYHPWVALVETVLDVAES